MELKDELSLFFFFQDLIRDQGLQRSDGGKVQILHVRLIQCFSFLFFSFPSHVCVLLVLCVFVCGVQKLRVCVSLNWLHNLADAESIS